MLNPKPVNEGFSTKIKKRIFMVIGAKTANAKGARRSENNKILPTNSVIFTKVMRPESTSALIN